jgi:NifB/MoaA-like Fe-S oxidoreductase
MAGLLPRAVLTRRDKRGPTAPFLRSLNQQAGWLKGVIAEARIVARGYADGEELRREVDRACAGRCINAYILMKAVTLEFWLRSLETIRTLESAVESRQVAHRAGGAVA